MPNTAEQEAMKKAAARRMIFRLWHKADANSAMEQEARRILSEAKACLESEKVSFRNHPLEITLEDGDLGLLVKNAHGKSLRATIRREGTYLQEVNSSDVAAVWDIDQATFKPTPDSRCEFALEAVLKLALEKLIGL